MERYTQNSKSEPCMCSLTAKALQSPWVKAGKRSRELGSDGS
jgi:hypothetical protein